MRRIHLAIAVLVVAGTVPPAVVAADPVAGTGGQFEDPVGQSREAWADPANDRIGWEAGYWHDEPIEVDQSDGLSDAEVRAYVGRAMARVELIRQAEFERPVPVEVIGREDFRGRATENGSRQAFGAWNNQVWEALFVDGEDSDVQEELGQTYGESVAGFYAPGDDEIRIVTPDPDRPTIDNGTLVHELTHALQDQTVGLRSDQFRSDTQDGGLAVDGLIEGEANLVETLYDRRCGDEWTCVNPPAPSSGGGGSEGQGGSGEESGSGDGPNLGILLTILQPYSDGPVYVNDLRQDGGWDAVRAAYDDPPESTEQTIHLTDETPTPIDFEDRARDGWQHYPDQGEDGSDTVGEASIYAMFWYQARTSGAETVDPRSVARTDSPFDTYNYDAEPSAGWANDRVFPYRDGPVGENDTGHGYVWVTEWDTERDAREFRAAYLEILSAHDARLRDDGIRVVEEGAFADSFRVVRNGTRVTIVNGPTPEAVQAIRPALDGDGGGDASGGFGSGVAAPGFGLPAAVLALVATAVTALARRRID